MKKKLILALIFLTALLILVVPVFAQDDTSTSKVTGRIINRSPDGTVPEEMELMLHAWDENFNSKLMLDGYAEADGKFEFVGVSLEPNLLYTVMLTYNDVAYASEPVSVTDGQVELSLEIPIYESTTDTSSVKIDRQHVLFDAALDGLLVGEIYILSNTGTRTITGQATGEDSRISSLLFPLPEGATNISFNESNSGGRFILTPGGFVDTAPLRPGPGTGQVVVTYLLPYEDALTYSWTAQWPVERLTLMLTSGIGPTLEGENLTHLGTQTMDGGGEVDVFSHDALEPGESVIVSLSGTLLRPLIAPEGDMVTTAETDAGSSSKRKLALGGGALGLALMAVGVWWYRRPEPSETEEAVDEAEASYDHLVTQIALLDEARARGEISRTEHDRQREQMVRQARALLTQSPEQDAASPSPSY